MKYFIGEAVIQKPFARGIGNYISTEKVKRKKRAAGWKTVSINEDNISKDFSKDIEEKKDLSAANPNKVKELTNALDNWEKTQTVKPAWPSAADVLIDVYGEEYYFPG